MKIALFQRFRLGEIIVLALILLLYFWLAKQLVARGRSVLWILIPLVAIILVVVTPRLDARDR